MRSQAARAEGPGNLGPDVAPFALSFRPIPAQSRPKKPGPGTGSTITEPEEDPPRPTHHRLSSRHRACLYSPARLAPAEFDSAGGPTGAVGPYPPVRPGPDLGRTTQAELDSE